ncbi:phage recombination protein Bet [Nonomuraea phyllanthi]|uniref:Phage recombination protein Bet n=1 Tax=Nonomuraea phyllanthi TaxID=2219224 RepID=A0A5C4V6I5_9ACTN|nr:phage recombination protein Bet [Nonomuraea phyllanthi]KAB8186952.1 phage recombination protein Bet [Nonomuraea phyllanthi]
MTVTDNLPATQGNGTLAIQPEQSMWTPYQRAVLATLGVADDCPNAVLAGYLHLCQKRGLDPFLKQVYLVGRNQKQRDGSYRTVYTPQTGIDGFRVLAQRAARRASIEYEYEDTIWFGPDGSQHEVWLASEPPAAAKVAVIKNGKRFSAVALYSAYVDTDRDGRPKNRWKTDPAGMTAKCAEALALRKAFPEDLGDLYTDDEMAHLDEEQPRDVIVGETIRETAAAKNGDATPGGATKHQRFQIVQLLSEKGITDPDMGLAYMAKVADREIGKSEDLTGAEAAQVMAALNRGDFVDEPPFTAPAEDNPLHYDEDEVADSEGGQS